MMIEAAIHQKLHILMPHQQLIKSDSIGILEHCLVLSNPE